MPALWSCKRVYENKDWNSTASLPSHTLVLSALQESLWKQGLKHHTAPHQALPHLVARESMKTRIETLTPPPRSNWNTRVARESMKTRIETRIQRLLRPEHPGCKRVYENKDWNKRGWTVYKPQKTSSCKRVYENKDWNCMPDLYSVVYRFLVARESMKTRIETLIF